MIKKTFSGVVFALVMCGLPSCVPSQVSTRADDTAQGRTSYELASGWVCMNVRDVRARGEELSRPSHPLSNYLPATVPGTILTTLVNNKLAPDPFYGMNNQRIADIYDTGRDTYTYWFVNDFREKPLLGNQRAWLCLRGVNYGCDIYLNGHVLTQKTHYGMFLRQRYDITSILSPDGNNRLAVLVYPPDPVGNPNGGQGGDGTIGRNVSCQYVAGWDWIQPTRDRNTGIWDKVTLERTNTIRLANPYVVTLVPGKRFPDQPQQPAVLRVSAELENPTSEPVRGALQYEWRGTAVRRDVVIQPFSTLNIQLPDHTLQNPSLWWPNGYGPQPLTTLVLQFIDHDQTVLDAEAVTIGIREIRTQWNPQTRSREVLVNGQRIFVKGGNWIASDAMLRLSPERYDAEVRFHHDMNLNLIRVWWGGITERPEFYDACDKYGLLVFQDFWMSGDCNGKWLDPMKKEDQWTRRAYPNDHGLFLRSVADQVKMIRNHPSLAFYCGGNEIPPPQDILVAMQDSLLPALDSSRYFFTFSNVDSMSYNFIGGNGDGAYHLLPNEHFWGYRSFPFNSEIGSVGLGDRESLERFIPPDDLVMPGAGRTIDSVWRYHKYLGYGNSIDRYGKPTDLTAYTERAQLLNYDQYRALMEGHVAHMWEWYTGVIIWKTQNPWTALRGQMYDYYLDPNAGLYGLRHANEPLHIMCNLTDGMLLVVNNTFYPWHDLMVQATTFDLSGKDSLVFQWLVELSPSSVQKIDTIKGALRKATARGGGFLNLRLLDVSRSVLSQNIYWLSDSSGMYTGLQHMATAAITARASRAGNGRIEVNIENPAGGPVAFFLRMALVNGDSRKRILPVFSSDNYISIPPGENRIYFLEHAPHLDSGSTLVSIRGWNVPEKYMRIE